MRLRERHFLALRFVHRASTALIGQRPPRVKQMVQPLSLNQRRSQPQQSNLARSSRKFRSQRRRLLKPSQAHTSQHARHSIMQGRTQPRTGVRHTSQSLQRVTNP